MKKKIVSILMMILLVASLTACGAKSECKELISNLEKACNQTSVIGILDCVEPETAEPLKAVVNLFGNSADTIMNFVFELLGITVEDAENQEKTLETIKIEPTEFELGDTEGTIKCTISFDAGDSKLQKDVTFKVKKVDDLWYISGLN